MIEKQAKTRACTGVWFIEKCGCIDRSAYIQWVVTECMRVREDVGVANRVYRI